MNKRCIFLVVPYMDFGGQERFVSKLTTILRDVYDVKLILFDDYRISYPLDSEYTSLNISSGKNLFGKIFSIIMKIWKLRRLMGKFRTYASISFGNNANIVNVLAGTGLSKTIISIRGYSSLLDLSEKGVKGYLLKFIFRKADKIICVSRLMADELGRIISSHRERICLLYNAYDAQEINNQSHQKSEIDTWFELYDVIIAVGTLRKEKGYWHLIKAFSVLKRKRNNIKLLLVGPDYMNNRPKLEGLIRDLGLEGDVNMLGYSENPFKYCAKSRLYVLSSISEGFPNALVEAMACQVPVIAADCKTGPREILSEDNYSTTTEDIEFAQYGILIPPLNSIENYDPELIEIGEEKLAEAMEILLSDTQLAGRYAIKSRERAEDFSYNRCRKEIVRIIEDN